MEFNDNEAIYLQIAAFAGDAICREDWKAGQRIPSVRELGIELEVNPNTVMRSYEFLQSEGVIFNRRGLGFFVAPEGRKTMIEYRRRRFMTLELPAFFKTLVAMDLELSELETSFQEFKLKNSKKPNT